MKDCLMCNRQVEEYATNSHVLSRFVLKRSKDNGQNNIIEMGTEKVTQKNQTDSNGNIIGEYE